MTNQSYILPRYENKMNTLYLYFVTWKHYCTTTSSDTHLHGIVAVMPRKSESIVPGMAIPGMMGITRGFANTVVEVTDDAQLFKDLYSHVSNKTLQLHVDNKKIISIVSDDGVIAQIPSGLQKLEPGIYELELYD